TEDYALSLHDALPIYEVAKAKTVNVRRRRTSAGVVIVGIEAMSTTESGTKPVKCRSALMVVSSISFTSTNPNENTRAAKNATPMNALRLGLIGFSGGRAGSNTVNRSPRCLRSRSAAMSAENFLLNRDLYFSLEIS